MPCLDPRHHRDPVALLRQEGNWLLTIAATAGEVRPQRDRNEREAPGVGSRRQRSSSEDGDRRVGEKEGCLQVYPRGPMFRQAATWGWLDARYRSALRLCASLVNSDDDSETKEATIATQEAAVHAMAQRILRPEVVREWASFGGKGGGGERNTVAELGVHLPPPVPSPPPKGLLVKAAAAALRAHHKRNLQQKKECENGGEGENGIHRESDDDNEEEEKEGDGERQPVKKRRFQDPSNPKRNVSAWIHFCNAKREKRSNPFRNIGERQKRLGAIWRGLSPQQRAPYIRAAAMDAERYKKEKRAYNELRARAVRSRNT
jgi:hypothetical protein